jgi:hypothetical protein
MQEKLKAAQSIYHSLKLPVIPVIGKTPAIKAWEKYGNEIPEEMLTHPNMTGIGLVMGSECPYTVVDIDADSPGIISILKSILPTTPVQRFGSKGIMLFYQKNEAIRTMHMPLIDIYSTTGQVVLPPSWNESAKAECYWVSSKLEDIAVDDLPCITTDHIQKLLDFTDQFKDRKEENTGRHNALVSQVMAALYKREDLEVIANQIADYDLSHHNPSYFKDPKHKYRCQSDKDVYKAAEGFVKSCLKSWEKGNGKYITEELVIGSSKSMHIQDQNEPPINLENLELAPALKFELKNYPKPEGILSDLVDYIKETSYTEVPNMALGSAIAIFATALGNKVEFEDIKANVFILLIADSGTGKSFGIHAAQNLLMESGRIGSADYNSSQAVASSLYDDVQRLDTIEEFSKLLKISKGNVWQAAIPQALASLWDASKGKYQLPVAAKSAEAKKQNIPEIIYNPYISILASTTPSELKANMNRDSFNSGFVPRFLFFIDNPTRRPKNRLDYQRIKELEINCAKSIKQFIKPAVLNLNPGASISFQLSLKDFETYDKHMDDFSDKSFAADNDAEKSMWSRLKMYYKKLAMIHSYSRLSYDVEEVDLVWAKEVCEISMHNLEQFMSEANVSNSLEKNRNKVLNVIKANPGINHRDLTRKFWDIATKELEIILKDLRDNDRINIASLKTKGRNAKNYYAI